MLQSCIVFLFPACYMFPFFSCHVGIFWSKICDISMLATPQTFCRVFPSALKFWPFNLYIIWLPSMTISLCFCFSFSQFRHVWNQYFHFVQGKWYWQADRTVAIIFLLSYLTNTIKCFLIAITALITLKCNIILCITGNLRRKLLETIRPQLENAITKVIYDFLQISLKASCSLKLSREGNIPVDVHSSSYTESLFVFRMSRFFELKMGGTRFVASSQGPDKENVTLFFAVLPLNLTWHKCFLLKDPQFTSGHF